MINFIKLEDLLKEYNISNDDYLRAIHIFLPENKFAECYKFTNRTDLAQVNWKPYIIKYLHIRDNATVIYYHKSEIWTYFDIFYSNHDKSIDQIINCFKKLKAFL